VVVSSESNHHLNLNASSYGKWNLFYYKIENFSIFHSSPTETATTRVSLDFETAAPIIEFFGRIFVPFGAILEIGCDTNELPQSSSSKDLENWEIYFARYVGRFTTFSHAIMIFAHRAI